MGWISSIPIFGKIIDKIFPDKNKKLDKIIAELQKEQAMEVEKLKTEGITSYIVLEESKGNFLQRSWRPALMYIFIAVLFNNVLLVPTLGYYFDLRLIMLHFPENIPDFVTYAVTGYIGARTLEKLGMKK
jgi:hypothetical protein